MPRTKLDATAFRRDSTRDLIKKSMRDQNGHITHTNKEIGKLWGVAESTASEKIRKMSMTYIEMLQLSKLFGWTEKERAKILEM